MSKMTYEQRRAMVGKYFFPSSVQPEDAVRVLAVGSATVFYVKTFEGNPESEHRISLREFQRRYPHMIED